MLGTYLNQLKTYLLIYFGIKIKLSIFLFRLKEDTAVGSVIYHLTGFDGDNDQVTFGVTSNPDNVVKIVNDPEGKNEADVLLSR